MLRAWRSAEPADPAHRRGEQRPVRRPRPAARRPVGYELSCATRPICCNRSPPPTVSPSPISRRRKRRSTRFAPPLRTRLSLLTSMTAGATNAAKTSAEHRDQRPAVVDRRAPTSPPTVSMCSAATTPASRRWRTTSRRRRRPPRAQSTRRSRPRSASRRLRRAPRISLPRQMQSFISGTFANLFSGASWTSNWSSASSTDVTTQIAPGEVGDDLDRRQPARLPAARRRLRDARRIRRLVAELRHAAGGHHRGELADQPGSLLADDDGGDARLGSDDASPTPRPRCRINSTILQTQIGNLDNVNASAVAVQLNSLQHAARNRLPAHCATAEDEPGPISPRSDPGNADV